MSFCEEEISCCWVAMVFDEEWVEFGRRPESTDSGGLEWEEPGGVAE